MEVTEQWKVEVVKEEEEVSLLGRRPRRHCSTPVTTLKCSLDLAPACSTDESHGEEEGSLERSVYLDKDGGIGSTNGFSGIKYAMVESSLSDEIKAGVDDVEATLQNVDAVKMLRTATKHQEEEKLNGETSHKEKDIHFKIPGKEPKEHAYIDLTGEIDEEIIELEFERAVQRLDTHSMFCPNCNSCITKVILRRRQKVQRPKQIDGLGCLSCFSIFIPSTGDGFNVFKMFKKKRQIPKTSPVDTSYSSSHIADHNGMTIEPGDYFNLFKLFKKKPGIPKTSPADISSSPSHAAEPNKSTATEPDHKQPVKGDNNVPNQSHISGQANDIASSLHGMPSLGPGKIDDGVLDDVLTDALKIGTKVQISPPQSPTLKGHVIIPVDDSSGTEPAATAYQPVPPSIPGGPLREDSKTFEILKSTVYGGLAESIASLSIVSSAAATEATTLNIVALGMANLIGGIFIIAHNLRELKNEQGDRYRRLLGQRENFFLHATVAVLSFLIFGLVPPVTYGFSFRKSDDKDLKIAAVAAASLLCIAILAFAKAYIRKPPKFYMYIKTVLYYVSNAVVVSGASYLVGDLIKKLMEKLGWFEPSGDAALSLPGMRSVSAAWGSY